MSLIKLTFIQLKNVDIRFGDTSTQEQIQFDMIDIKLKIKHLDAPFESCNKMDYWRALT